LFYPTKKEYQFGIMLLFIGGIIYFFIKIKIVLIPFIIGIIFSYLFNPFIIIMKKRGFSRQGAIILLIGIILIIFIFAALILIPVLFNELESLALMLPGYINSIEGFINYIGEEYKRLRLPLMIKDIINEFLHRMEEFIIGFINNITESLPGVLTYILSILIAPIITYYILKDKDELQENIIKAIPRKKRLFFLKLGKEINMIFVGYLRGQVWISVIVGVLSSIGLYFLKVKFFLLLGLISGITNMIPYFGPIIGGIPAVLIALLSSPLKALGVLVLYVLIQQLESSIISPKIMSERVGLHPLTVIFALLSGAELMGIWGLILGIPIAGSIKALIKLTIQYLVPIKNRIE
jgi:predicted PurR-regulated permease PerM